MSAAPINLRRLLPEHAPIYREIRLEALKNSPDAFSSTFEAEKDRPLDWFAARLTAAFVLGAFSGSQLVGIAAFYVQAGPKHRHKGMLWGMYVRPQHRAAGVGRMLVEAIIRHAHKHVELLQLFVISENAPARRLYSSLGFVEYGIERRATKYQGQYHDDVLMVLPLVVETSTAASREPTEDVPA